jgi:hypothetical protein
MDPANDKGHIDVYILFCITIEKENGLLDFQAVRFCASVESLIFDFGVELQSLRYRNPFNKTVFRLRFEVLTAVNVVVVIWLFFGAV